MIHSSSLSSPRYPFTFWICLLLCVVSLVSNAQMPPGFIRQPIADHLNPTSMVIAPDGRIFITEKHGVIRIVQDDQILTDPFLILEVDDSNERGLGHMVLHPDFEQNGYYYVFYAVPGLRFNRVSRFTANGNTTIPGSELIIVNLDQLGADIHNGGDMVFGFDGYLYIATGDGGQNWRGEDLGSTNGKILRVDEFGKPVPDNPWYESLYLRANHVYAYGLRNPFTLTIHPFTGDIYANDVGFSKYEEVNRIERGGFYGWPRVEGKRTNEEVPAEYKDPLFQYSHSNYYCAIVGSAFYLPSVQQFPEQYRGRYFYSDYCTGRIRMLDVETGIDKGVFISDGDRVVDMDVSSEGSFYYLERKGIGDGSQEDNTGTDQGMLWKVSYTGSGAPFISVPIESELISVGEDAVFNVTASGALPLTYRWFINDEEIDTISGSQLRISNALISQDSSAIQVVIENSFGQAASEIVLLRVTSNQRPQPVITSPGSGTNYTAGQVINFSGFADDPEEGVLTSAGLSWRIDFHHGSHSHPSLSWTSGMTHGEWAIPSLGETSIDVWYRIYLKATDSEGFSKIVYTDIHPVLGKITVDAEPSGLNINLDGVATLTPFDIEGVIGLSRYISPPVKQVKDDSTYFFTGWKDGSLELNREIKPGIHNQHYVGSYEGIATGKGYGLTAYYFNNQNFEGPPVAVAIDELIDNQYLGSSPYPGVTADDFSIIWKGFIQPYKTGLYQFTVYSDDGLLVEINDHTLIEDWEAGTHYETASIYLEAGRLYPIHLRMYELLWGAQMRLRWSSPDFPEEVVPTSQLYPEDYLTHPYPSGLFSMQVIVDNGLQVRTESYEEVLMTASIITVDGKMFEPFSFFIPIGKNIESVDISQLPPGLYYIKFIETISGDQVTRPFVKVR